MNNYRNETALATELGDLKKLAQEAVALYGLVGAQVSLLSRGERPTFKVSMAIEPRPPHPYLGRIAGKSYVLQLRPGISSSVADVHDEVAWLMTLALAADLDLPEAVPASNGRLAVEVEADGGEARTVCVLYRWVDGREIDGPILGWPQYTAGSGLLSAAESCHLLTEGRAY